MRVNNSTTFTRNFNGEAIKPNEVMVPFEYTELEAEKVVNPECIRTIETAGQYFKVIYKAVPQEWAKRAKTDMAPWERAHSYGAIFFVIFIKKW